MLSPGGVSYANMNSYNTYSLIEEGKQDGKQDGPHADPTSASGVIKGAGTGSANVGETAAKVREDLTAALAVT